MSTPLLVYISAASILMPTVVAAIQFGKFNSLEKSIARMLFLVALIQGVALVWSDLLKQNNMPLYHFYLLLEFNLLFRIYSSHIFRIQRSWVLTAVAILSGVAFLCNGLWFEAFSVFPSYLRATTSLLSAVLAIVYFLKKLIDLDGKPLQSDPAFWMSCGVFIYYTTNTLLFFYSKVLVSSPEVFNYTWLVHSYLNILLYVFYTIVLVCRKKR